MSADAPREQAYFDTSVLVTQYVEEAGPVSVRRLFLRFQVVSSALTPVEMMSALARQRAAGVTWPCAWVTATRSTSSVPCPGVRGQ
jgi:hypothetical protein